MVNVRFRETLVFLFFLLLAGLIWYGHAMSSVRSATLPVTIHYKGIPDNILFDEPLPGVVHIEVRDAGRRLKAYRNTLELTFDVTEQLTHDSGEVHITANQLRNGINTLLQGTTKLQNISPEQLYGKYFRQHSKKVAVHLTANVSPATQYQFVGEPAVQPQRVNVFGRKEQLDTLSSLNTLLLKAEDIKDTVVLTTTIAVPEGLRVVDNNVRVTYVAEQFTEKVLTKPIIPRHVPGGTHLRLFPNEVTVFLRVGVAHFNDINDNDVRVICEFPKAQTDKLPLQVECSNPYVTYSRCNPANAEFLIEKSGVKNQE